MAEQIYKNVLCIRVVSYTTDMGDIDDIGHLAAFWLYFIKFSRMVRALLSLDLYIIFNVSNGDSPVTSGIICNMYCMCSKKNTSVLFANASKSRPLPWI